MGQTTAAAEGTLLHISATQQNDNHTNKLPNKVTISGHVQKHSEEQHMAILKNTLKNMMEKSLLRYITRSV